MIDQFIVAGRSKWKQTSRLTLLLPHGYEGNGPEHSSARLERFLQLGAQENIRVANCTTAAQYFHLLRRQALDAVARPLVLMTPKGLLRLKQAASSLDELAGGGFQAVLDDSTVDHDAVERLVLCSGKLYYDIVGHELRDAAGRSRWRASSSSIRSRSTRSRRCFGATRDSARSSGRRRSRRTWGRGARSGTGSRRRCRASARETACSTSAGRGRRARARATRPRTTASRTASCGSRSASSPPGRGLLRAFGGRARAVAAAAAPAASRGPCVRAARSRTWRCAGRQPAPEPEEREPERDGARRNPLHACIQAHRRFRPRGGPPIEVATLRAWPETQTSQSTETGWQPTRAFPSTSSADDALIDGSALARAIQEHLDLKQRNASLDGDMPLDKYSVEDPFENHPLFKSEEQARLEETLDGVEATRAAPALPWPGESPERRGRLRSTTRLWGRSRDFDWGE